MKYIEKIYQQLIDDMERAHESVVDSLKNQILYLEKRLSEKEGTKITEQLEEYNKLEDREPYDVLLGRYMTVCDENVKMADELDELRKDLDSMGIKHEQLYSQFESTMATNQRLAEELRGIKSKEPKPKKGKGIYARKNVVMYCQDCGKYFNAKSKAAKRCPKCRAARARAYKNEYQKKKRAEAKQK